jgi:hypothetical protein
MTPRRAAVTSVAAVVGAVCLLLVVALWAASIGPDRALRGPGLQRVTDVSSPSTDPPSAAPTRQSDVDRTLEHPGQASPFLKLVALLVELALAAAVIWLAFRLARRSLRAWRERVRAPARPEHVEFEVLEEPTPSPKQVEQEAQAALELLDDGEPRNAIVAAWEGFELSSEDLGFGRRPWETSSEFVLRMLAVVQADRGAVLRLEGLYREARYSTHPLGEDARDRARSALLDIQRSLLDRTLRR